jgi:two-component system, LuxR family, sensor kinase FixL
VTDYARLSRAELIERLIALGSNFENRRTTTDLSDSRERMRAVLHTAVEGIITIDERGIIESLNPAAEKIFGYKAGELVGKNVSVLMPAPYRQEHDSYLANYRRTGKAKIIGIGREVVGKRKDGSVFPMDLSVGEVRLTGGRMFTGIVRDITERRRLEKEVLEISDREQRRIGQDLHDGLGQHLAGIELMAEVLEQKLAPKSKGEAARVAEITGYVREAIRQAKLLARGLAPVVLESEGLMSALQQLASNSEKMFQIACEFHCQSSVLIEDDSVGTQLYRIAQEAISNAVKHGRAKRVQLHLRAPGDRIVLMIKDDGAGFRKASPKHPGMGLRVMQYRAGMIGGTLSIQQDLNGGTSVVCSLRSQTGNVVSPSNRTPASMTIKPPGHKPTNKAKKGRSASHLGASSA